MPESMQPPPTHHPSSNRDMTGADSLQKGIWRRVTLRRFAAWLMDSGPDGPPGERLPRAFLVFLLLFSLGMILISLVGDQGLIAYYHLRGDAGTLRSEVADLKEKRRHLTQEIIALREDPDTIEMLARRRLGWVRPGETVLQLPTPTGRE